MPKAYEQPGFYLSAPAGADLTTAQYKIVKLDVNGAIVLAASITDNIIGVLQNGPVINGIAKVMVTGITKVISGATVTPGQTVGSHATAGTAIVALATAQVLGTVVIGGSSGEQISVLLEVGGIY